MNPPLPPQRPWADRVRQALLFEISGLLIITPAFAWLTNQALSESALLLAVLSVIATLWNGVYNTIFDRLEGRLTGRPADRRPPRLRLLHAIGFEGGLVVLTLPVVVAFTGLPWLTALAADLGLAVAYAGYAYLYHLAYDRLFPVVRHPASPEIRP